MKETKFALECVKRKRKLEDRFRRTRLKSGMVRIFLVPTETIAEYRLSSSAHPRTIKLTFLLKLYWTVIE